VGGETS